MTTSLPLSRATDPTWRAAGGTRAATAAALTVAAAMLVGLVAGLALHVANEGAPVTHGVTDWWLMPIVAGVAFGGTGAWLVAHRPLHVIGWLLASIGVVSVASSVALEYGVHSLATDARLPLADTALWFGNWSWVAAVLTAGTVLPLLLPDGQLPSRRWRGALWLSVVAVAATAAGMALTPYESWSPALAAAHAHNPTGMSWVLHPVPKALQAVLTLPAAALALAAVVVRWRSAPARSETRQQLKWVLYGAVLSLVFFALGFAVGPVASALAMVPLPAACVVAALRYGLWDIDVVISRSLVYATLTAAVIGVYVAVVSGLGSTLGRTTGAPLLATAVVAVAIAPVHRRIQHGVNRLVHGEQEEPLAVLARWGQQLGATKDETTVTEQVLPEVVAAVACSLRLPYAAVVLADGTSVAHGTPTGSVDRIGLRYGGADVGELVVASTDGLGRRGRRALQLLADQAAVAAHTVTLARDVRRSRELAVTSREEERRRLYRDLHDGLGPSLAALALQVETARSLVADDAAAAERILERALQGLQGTVRDVRVVVNDLRPASLDDLGLGPALQELGRRFAGPRLAVEVTTTGCSGLPAAVEVAAYQITAEALTNAVRHSGCTRVTVVADGGGDGLSVRVFDDGGGMAADARRGVGLESMRLRAEEVGGRLVVGAGDDGHGTSVEAWLPVMEA